MFKTFTHRNCKTWSEEECIMGKKKKKGGFDEDYLLSAFLSEDAKLLGR